MENSPQSIRGDTDIFTVYDVVDRSAGHSPCSNRPLSLCPFPIFTAHHCSLFSNLSFPPITISPSSLTPLPCPFMISIFYSTSCPWNLVRVTGSEVSVSSRALLQTGLTCSKRRPILRCVSQWQALSILISSRIDLCLFTLSIVLSFFNFCALLLKLS